MSAWSSTRRTRTELFKGTPNRPGGAFAWSPASDEPIANDLGVYHISFRAAMPKPAMSLGDVALASHDKSSSPLGIFSYAPGLERGAEYFRCDHRGTNVNSMATKKCDCSAPPTSGILHSATWR